MEKVYVNWEESFKDVIKSQGNEGLKYVKEQLSLWLKNGLFKEINNYFIIEMSKIYIDNNKHENEFIAFKNDHSVFKSFTNSYDAINYCLDKMNSEKKQINIFE